MRELGRGGTGVVYLARSPEGREVASASSLDARLIALSPCLSINSQPRTEFLERAARFWAEGHTMLRGWLGALRRGESTDLR